MIFFHDNREIFDDNREIFDDNREIFDDNREIFDDNREIFDDNREIFDLSGEILCGYNSNCRSEDKIAYALKENTPGSSTNRRVMPEGIQFG
jgi:hypothetical protein